MNNLLIIIDQSPANLADHKRYDPDYLRLLSKNLMCQKKPENLPDFDIYVHCSRVCNLLILIDFVCFFQHIINNLQLVRNTMFRNGL